MQRLASAVGLELEWVHISLLRREYELRGGDAVFATLERQGSFGSLATAKTADGSWTFKRGGFLRPKVTARLEGTDTEVASLQLGWRGEGTLALRSGPLYAWANAGFWQAAWGFRCPSGESLVQFRRKFTVARKVTRLELAAGAHARPEVPLLATLGWYLLVLRAAEADGAAAYLRIPG